MDNMNTIKIKRIYEDPSENDGYRILIDRVWPRGVSKEDAKLDDWKKDIAPSNELRKWFDHDPDKFGEFAKRYRKELEDKKEDLKEVRKKAKDQASGYCRVHAATSNDDEIRHPSCTII